MMRREREGWGGSTCMWITRDYCATTPQLSVCAHRNVEKCCAPVRAPDRGACACERSARFISEPTSWFSPSIEWCMLRCLLWGVWEGGADSSLLRTFLYVTWMARHPRALDAISVRVGVVELTWVEALQRDSWERQCFVLCLQNQGRQSHGEIAGDGWTFGESWANWLGSQASSGAFYPWH